MTPIDFFHLLWPDKPADQYIQIWTPGDKLSRWFLDADRAAEFVDSVRGQDVYTGFGLSPKDYGPHHRCVSNEISSVGGVWSDLDLHSDAHKTKPLPRTFSGALSILPPDLPPSLVLSTGNGLQAWWFVKEIETFENQEQRDATAALLSRFHTLLRMRSQAQGWAYDRLADLARILRMPGTTNAKDKANIKEVSVLSESGRRYNFSELKEYLDDAKIPDQAEQSKIVREWAERFKDKPLVVSLDARIPQRLLDTWMDPDKVGVQVAMKFRNTWEKKRHDLPDQSSSGYDLALANFGMDAGITEQQIIDLIVHHRSIHSGRQRKSVDYFERTIARAWSRSGEQKIHLAGEEAAASEAPPDAPPAPAPPAPAQEPGPAPADPSEAPPAGKGAPTTPAAPAEAQPRPQADVQKVVEIDRYKRTQALGQKLGITIVRIVRVTGKEPTFYLVLGDTRSKIEFSNVMKMLCQDSLRAALAANLKIWPNKIKPRLWDEVAKELLAVCEDEEGGEELDWAENTVLYTTQYLIQTGFIDSVVKERAANARRPLLLDDKIAICASDLHLYMNKVAYQMVTVRQVASGLSAVGAKQYRYRGPGFKEQSRWLLPVDLFDPEDIKRRRLEDTKNA